MTVTGFGPDDETAARNFANYVPRQALARFLVRNALFKKQLNVKGSVIECGVHYGGGLMTWAQLSAVYEPYNYHRKVIGFDTFQGFPDVQEVDVKGEGGAHQGQFAPVPGTLDAIEAHIAAFDQNRYLNHIPKVELVVGNAVKSIPQYVSEHGYLIVSLLYLDFDIFEPTLVALEQLLPRMPRGAILAFDELHNPDWPGETKAMLQGIGLAGRRLRSFEWEPNISYVEL